MKPEIISRETIKPSSPTPHSQIWYKLSVFDQMSYGMYIPIILFYTSNGDDNLVDFSHRLSGLKKSLSETLTRYYPLDERLGMVGVLSSRIGPFGVGYSQWNSISHSHLYTNRKIILFFSLSFFGRDEDYMAVYFNKILYLSFSHKYILKIINFFLFFTCFYGIGHVFGSN